MIRPHHFTVTTVVLMLAAEENWNEPVMERGVVRI
jgi:hypothetical protein